VAAIHEEAASAKKEPLEGLVLPFGMQFREKIPPTKVAATTTTKTVSVPLDTDPEDTDF